MIVRFGTQFAFTNYSAYTAEQKAILQDMAQLFGHPDKLYRVGIINPEKRPDEFVVHFANRDGSDPLRDEKSFLQTLNRYGVKPVSEMGVPNTYFPELRKRHPSVANRDELLILG